VRHVAPEVWAELAAGRLAAQRQARLERHARSCAACQRVREQVLAARATLHALREVATPELGWDSIRAKLRWELSPAGSSSTRLPAAARWRAPRWARAGALGGALTAALVAATVLILRSGPAHRDAAAPTLAAAQPPAGPRAVAALRGLVTRARGAVQIDGEASIDALFARPVEAGAVLATGEGRLDVQFGEGTALAVGPRSSVRLGRFDAELVELFVDGVVDVEVARRSADQRFVVHAGAQTVEVRGTQFRVEHRADQTHVSCRHGLVTVHEGRRSVAVAAGQHVAVRTGEAMPAPSALLAPAAVELALASPYQLPWDAAAAVASSTARLELSAPAGRRLRLDGVELGAGAASVRVARGRHLVESSSDGGPFRRVGWAVVDAQAQVVSFAVDSAAPRRAAGSKQRLAQLRSLVDRARLARCVRPIAKQGLGRTYLDVELSVARDGAIGYLNITDTDLPAELAECVRDVVAAVRFAPGPAAVVVEHLEL
jgi:ferric-dicitrate binding protein FerR (iron transport regulator)